MTRDLAAFWRDRGEPGIAGRVVDSLTADGSTPTHGWTFTPITGRMIGE